MYQILSGVQCHEDVIFFLQCRLDFDNQSLDYTTVTGNLPNDPRGPREILHFETDILLKIKED